MKLRAVVAIVGMLMAAGCSSTHRHPAMLPGALTPPSVPASLDDGCGHAGTTVVPDEIGTVHTVPPRPTKAIYAVTIAPATVCPGGSVLVVVRVTNPTGKTLTASPEVIITRPSVALACCRSVTVAAGTSITITKSVTIPASTPLGSHEVRFRDYLAGNPTADQTAQLVVRPRAST